MDRFLLGAVALGAVGVFGSFALTSSISASEVRQNPVLQQDDRSTVVTLLSHDDIRCSYSFRDKDVGMLFREGQIFNRGSEIMYDRYGSNVLAVAVEGGTEGTIVDLGDLKTGNPPQSIFWSLSRSGDKVMETDLAAMSLRSSATAAAVLGHTYVIKCVAKDGKGSRSWYVVLKVIDLEPGRSMTMRWRYLE
jgi:hypothetical protein